MNLQLSVFLLFILFTAGHSLRCYECTSLTGSCAGQTETTCPELYKCASVTAVTLIDGKTISKIKSCLPSYSYLDTNFSSADVSFFSCNTDLCNAKDAELSGDSSPNIFNVPNIPNIFNISNVLNDPNIFNVPNPPIPNGKKCYYCDGQSCLNIMDCSGSQDRCMTATVTYQGQTFPVNGCSTKAVCDSIVGVSCCEGNLCNGAQSVTQSFLFLCCSLLSYFLLH